MSSFKYSRASAVVIGLLSLKLDIVHYITICRHIKNTVQYFTIGYTMHTIQLN